MPQKWFAALRVSRPTVAKALEDVCCMLVSDETHLTPKYVHDVFRGQIEDASTLDAFWLCMKEQKEVYERGEQDSRPTT
jgi:hypothetical protein